MKRIFDVSLSIALISALSFLMLLIAILVKLSSSGPVLYWSSRVGRYGAIFRMPKFRTMLVDTPEVASDLLKNPSDHMTLIGPFLRVTSLDELPQLWSILLGDMSFVGPRPALFNQSELISLREQYGISQLSPGLTGLAQIHGRDQLSISEKVQFDLEYLLKRSFWFDMRIMGLTFLLVLRRSGVAH